MNNLVQILNGRRDERAKRGRIACLARFHVAGKIGAADSAHVARVRGVEGDQVQLVGYGNTVTREKHVPHLQDHDVSPDSLGRDLGYQFRRRAVKLRNFF